jgi:hypothetical protein
VSKALPISKNTAAVDMLLLKLRVTWSVNLIHYSVCGLHGIQTDFHLASFLFSFNVPQEYLQNNFLK